MPDKIGMTEKDKVERFIIEMSMAEFAIDEHNHEDDNQDFEVHMNLFDLIGDEPDEDWMSNIKLPEFWGEIITQNSLEAASEFKRRDFVEIYHESKEPRHLAAGEADKELINRTLNQSHIHYFQKRMRASGLRNITGKVYYRTWWERKTVKFNTVENRILELNNDINGEPITSEDQIRQRLSVPVDVQKEHVIYDRWNFDVFDSRNVFTSREYCYTLQDKKRVTIRFDTDIGEMEENKDFMDYINLDKIEEALKGADARKTETKTGDDQNEPEEYMFSNLKPIMILETYKKEWVKVGKGEDNTIKPGYDGRGEQVKGAILMEIVKSIAHLGDKKILVRYQRQKNRDPLGNPFRPISKGICYIHPTSDLGTGDGKASRGPQIAMNDVFGMSMDKLRIALTPIIKAGTTSASEFRSTWEYAPRAVWEAYDPKDIQEMVMDDNISNALNLVTFFKATQNQSTATTPQTQGVLPLASTTATATADASARTDARSHYKGLTHTYTALNEIYQFIKWQTYQNALPETAKKLLGKKVFDFDPFADHTFKIVTESIETNESKEVKLNLYNQQFAQIQVIPNKNTLKGLNRIIVKQAKLLGDEYEDVVDTLFDEDEEFVPTGGGGGTPANVGLPTSNQSNVRQSIQERGVRASV